MVICIVCSLVVGSHLVAFLSHFSGKFDFHTLYLDNRQWGCCSDTLLGIKTISSIMYTAPCIARQSENRIVVHSIEFATCMLLYIWLYISVKSAVGSSFLISRLLIHVTVYFCSLRFGSRESGCRISLSHSCCKFAFHTYSKHRIGSRTVVAMLYMEL